MSILDRIDDTLDDWHGSQDSVHWTPDAEQDDEGHEPRNPTYLELLEQQHAAMIRRHQEQYEQAQRPGANALPHISFGFAPAGTDPRDDEAFTSLDDYLTVAVTRHVGALTQIIDRAAQAERDAQVAQASRLAWSGPDKMQRQIARAFGIPVGLLGLTPGRSVWDARHHRRYRNRQGRR